MNIIGKHIMANNPTHPLHPLRKFQQWCGIITLAFAGLALIINAGPRVANAEDLPHGIPALPAQDIRATVSGAGDDLAPTSALKKCLELVDIQYAVLGRQALLLEFKDK